MDSDLSSSSNARSLTGKTQQTDSSEREHEDKVIMRYHGSQTHSVIEEIKRLKSLRKIVGATSMTSLCADFDSLANPSQRIQFAPEWSIKPSMPNWETIALFNGKQCKHMWCSNLDELLQKIENKKSIEIQEMDPLQVQIAKHPFRDEGTVRWPYHARVLQQGLQKQTAKSMVVRSSKLPFGQSNKNSYKHSLKGQHLSQMEVQTVSALMAHEFNFRTSQMQGVKEVKFTLVSTLEVGSKFYNMEKFLEGQWIGYSHNVGYVNTAEYAATFQAFTHWTHERSDGLLMVTNLQGVFQASGVKSRSNFWLCDSSLHCVDLMRFTDNNLGRAGFKLFYNSHKCNDICRRLGLKHTRPAALSANQVKTTD